MHELFLAKDIVEQTVAEAEREGAAGVSAITLCFGPDAHFSPEGLTFGIQAASQGTIAEGARVQIKLVQEEGVVLESLELWADS